MNNELVYNAFPKSIGKWDLDLESQFNSLILPLIILELVQKANNDEILEWITIVRIGMLKVLPSIKKVGNMVVQFIFKLHLNKSV
jgi:hypothetical protein